uniref:Uncharacterized protein n=1 Tax=Arundo donax TaxID=35708 RepID=A0A0A8YHA2_ARUDO
MERQSPSRGPFSGFAEGSFSSGHVAEPIVPSAKDHRAGEWHSPWWRKVEAVSGFSVKQEGLMCLSW